MLKKQDTYCSQKTVVQANKSYEIHEQYFCAISFYSFFYTFSHRIKAIENQEVGGQDNQIFFCV